MVWVLKALLDLLPTFLASIFALAMLAVTVVIVVSNFVGVSFAPDVTIDG